MKEVHCLNCYQKNNLIMSASFEHKGKEYAYAACPDCGFVMKATITKKNISSLVAAPNTQETIVHAYQHFQKTGKAPGKAKDYARNDIDVSAISNYPDIDLAERTEEEGREIQIPQLGIIERIFSALKRLFSRKEEVLEQKA